MLTIILMLLLRKKKIKINKTFIKIKNKLETKIKKPKKNCEIAVIKFCECYKLQIFAIFFVFFVFFWCFVFVL